jgi:hypothetical protein
MMIHNEEDQRIFEDWLAEDQHQREVQQNTHPRQQQMDAPFPQRPARMRHGGNTN